MFLLSQGYRMVYYYKIATKTVLNGTLGSMSVAVEKGSYKVFGII